MSNEIDAYDRRCIREELVRLLASFNADDPVFVTQCASILEDYIVNGIVPPLDEEDV